jgi:hypothetical protein
MDGLTWLPHGKLIWLVADTYAGTRREFAYLLEASNSLAWTNPDTVIAPRTKERATSFETKWGCKVESMSLQDDKRIAAYGPDLILVCEPGLLTKDIVWRFRERLSGRRGQLLMAGSFEQDAGWMMELAEVWKHWPKSEGKFFLIPSWTNTALYPGGKHDPAIEGMRKNMSRYDFLLRVAGVPTEPPELIFSGLIRPDTRKPDANVVEYDKRQILQDPNILVEVAIDPGYSDGVYAVHPIAWDGKRAWIFDEIRMSGAIHSEVIGKAMSQWWWHRVAGGTLDPWAGTHHVFGSSSPQEVWQREAHIRLRCDWRVGIEDGIERHKWWLLDPVTGEQRLLVDPSATGLIYEYGHWKRKKVGEGDERTKSPSKLGCDSIKAITGWLVDRYMRSFQAVSPRGPYKSSPMSYKGRNKARWF